MSELTWTTTTPTEPGFWWVEEPDFLPHIVRLVGIPNHPEAVMQVRTTGGGFGSLKFYFTDGTRWAGPLPKPQEPPT